MNNIKSQRAIEELGAIKQRLLRNYYIQANLIEKVKKRMCTAFFKKIRKK